MDACGNIPEATIATCLGDVIRTFVLCITPAELNTYGLTTIDSVHGLHVANLNGLFPSGLVTSLIGLQDNDAIMGPT